MGDKLTHSLTTLSPMYRVRIHKQPTNIRTHNTNAHSLQVKSPYKCQPCEACLQGLNEVSCRKHSGTDSSQLLGHRVSDGSRGY